MDHRLLIAAIVSLAVGCQPAASTDAPTQSASKGKVPPAADSRLKNEEETFGQAVWHGQETVPQQGTLPPQPVFRPDDRRPQHDDAKLAALGVQRYESKRLRLYTDIEAQAAKPLPALIDQAFDALAEYFGPLPPARDGSDFQMTGYLVRDENLFREAALIPEDLPTFEHGRHRGNEFWMRDQEFDYYRRHLLIHEVTHCVMMFVPGDRAPVWYLEGMAELFGTYRLTDAGVYQWGVMPDSPENFAGMGRITLVRQDIARGNARSAADVQAIPGREFLKPTPYAWSWALCHFLARHPRYQERFRELGRQTTSGHLTPQLSDVFEDYRDLEAEWSLFSVNLQYGYDLPPSVIDFVPGSPLTEIGDSREANIAADRGWQSTHVLLEAGQSYAVTADGQFTLATRPKPWVSEPQGISIRYFDGFPLGTLLACVRSDEQPESLRKVLPIGRRRQFVAPVTGTLYLRLNDSWSDLADNSGTVTVGIQRVESSSQ